METAGTGKSMQLKVQRWAVIQPDGPRWLLALGERVGQVEQDANPPHVDLRLAKQPA